MDTIIKTIDAEILSSLKRSVADRQVEAPGYAQRLKYASLSTDRYRQEAMRQIREAIANMN